jgi:hypothetical protein
MADERLNELIAEYREAGREEDATDLEKLRDSTLRKKALRAEELERSIAETEAEATRLEKAPQIEKAFTDAGIDHDKLSRLERKAVESYDGPLDEADVANFMEANELPFKR